MKKGTMGRLLAAVTVLAIWSLATGVSYADRDWETNGPGYTKAQCESNILPTAATNPTWTWNAGVEADKTAFIDDGDGHYLRITDNDGVHARYDYSWTGVSASNGFTVLFDARRVSASADDLYEFYFFADDYRIYMDITMDGVICNYANDKNKYALDTTNFHTYRVTFEGTTQRIYVDENLTPFYESVNTNANSGDSYVRWGASGSGGGTGVMDFKSFVYTADGAVAPIPEPSALLLLGGGGLGLITLFRIKRRVS